MAAYGGDVSVYVEDKAGDQGLDPTIPGPFWLSPDVDIPAHTGEASQGSNTVQIRVHSHDEPIPAAWARWAWPGPPGSTGLR